MKQYKNLNIAKPAKKKKLKEIQDLVSEAKRKFECSFWEDPNIVSIGVGFKIKGDSKILKDKQGDELVCIKFMVSEKIAPETFVAEGLTKSKLIPESLEYNGIKIYTDVEERKYKPHYTIIDKSTSRPESIDKNYRKQRQNTILPGLSVSNVNGTAGTIGAIVYDNKTYTPYILSNWHVLAGHESKIGDTIVQPGPYDDNRIEQNTVGSLVRSFLGMAGDCAICTIEDRNFEETIFGLGTKPDKIAIPDLGDKVVKSGRTTDVTSGVISQVNMTTRMEYKGMDPVTISSFEITPLKTAGKLYEISLGGDSGSLWVINDHSKKVAVGLHFAGESSGNDREFALACYINKVLDKLDVHIPDSSAEAVPKKTSAAKGYNSKFIKPEVKLPSTDKIKGILKVGNSSVVKYNNFSVVMHKQRRVPVYVACNIDGAQMEINHMKAVPRPTWKTDEEVGADNQLTNSNFYKKTKVTFDRGHMVRRFDPMWGSNALAGHDDTFYFTNVIPQYHSFNAGIWNDLEDWIIYDADTKDRKVNVFTGPIFMADDEVHVGVPIPYYFWKVIVRYKKSKKKLSAIAFIMGSGGDTITEEGLKAEAKRINLIPNEKVAPYQVSVKMIESYTKLDFSTLSKFDASDTFDFNAETVDVFKPITGKDDLVL